MPASTAHYPNASRGVRETCIEPDLRRAVPERWLMQMLPIFAVCFLRLRRNLPEGAWHQRALPIIAPALDIKPPAGSLRRALC